MPQVVNIRIHTDECLQGMEAAIHNALEAIGLDASSTAQRAAPHKTGALRNSIYPVIEGTTVYIGTNIPYAVYQELGTSKISGKHFLQFGATAHSNEYAAIVERHLKGE